MEDSLKHLHVHELQAMLDKTSKETEPDRYETIERLIKLGGYKAPIEVTGNFNTEITNKYFKWALYVFFGLGLIGSIFSLLSGSILAIIALSINGYALYSLITRNKSTEVVLSIVAYFYVLMTLLTGYVLYYSATKSTEDIIELVFNALVSFTIFYGAKKFLKIVEK